MSDRQAPDALGPDSLEAGRGRMTVQAGIVSAGTLLTRVVGFLRDAVIAAVFPRPITDAWNVAFTIPDVLRQMFSEGAVQATVLPVLSHVRETQGEPAARQYFRTLRAWSLVALALLALAGVLFARPLVAVFAAGSRQDPAQLERTVLLTRWIFPHVLFSGTAALSLAALHVHRRFVVASFAPALVNVTLVVFALTLPNVLARFGYEPALALASAASVGALLQVLAQWPSLRAMGYLEAPRFRWNDAAVRETERRMGPVLLGMAAYYAHVIVARRLLSTLEVGAQSYFGWALRLCDFPQAVFAMALQAATLPSLARLAGRGQDKQLRETFAFSLRMVLFVAIPASALVVGLSQPLVALLFERGQFDATATRETARALLAQGLGISLVACIRQLSAVYYALGDTRTPFIASLTDLVTFAGLSWLLRPASGHFGIGIAVSAAHLPQLLLLWWRLRLRQRTLLGRPLLFAIARTLLCALAAAGCARVGVSVLTAHGASGSVLPGLAGLALFMGAFWLAAKLTDADELRWLSAALPRRRARL